MAIRHSWSVMVGVQPNGPTTSLAPAAAGATSGSDASSEKLLGHDIAIAGLARNTSTVTGSLGSCPRPCTRT